MFRLGDNLGLVAQQQENAGVVDGADAAVDFADDLGRRRPVLISVAEALEIEGQVGNHFVSSWRLSAHSEGGCGMASIRERV